MVVLIAGCFAVLSWLSSFIGRLVRLAPLQVLVSMLVSLCSQLFQILAFLLPLKVMILLGSSGVPSYFPQLLVGVERERLILLLAAIAVLLYLMHLLMDFIGAALARAGSERLIQQPQEGEELSRQRKIAQSFYQGVITVATGSVFALGVLVFLGVFNALLLVVVLGYFLAVFLIGALVLRWVPALLEKVVTQFSRVVDMLSACGFLLVFGVLVECFLYGDTEGLWLGILTLLLCRQMFSRMAMALKNIERLYGHRERALRVLGGLHVQDEFDDELSGDLLEGADEPPGLLDGDDGALVERRSAPGTPPFWNMVDPAHCSAWIREVLATAGVSNHKPLIEQLDAGRRGELALHLTCGGAGQRAEYFLLKMFNRKEAKRVSRAAALLAPYPGEAAVRLRAVIERDGFAAHLYEWAEQARQPEDVQVLYVCREQAFIESCTWSVPELLFGGHQSGSLVSRCNPALWARCKAFSRWLDADTRQLVDELAAAPLRLQSALGALPLRLYNPDIILDNIYVLAGDPRALRWENWTLEPIGSGWPLELGLERLDQRFALLSESSDELRSLSLFQVRLAALAFAFEERCARWAYLDAFALLGKLRDTLDALDR
ncbi:hypothetical protein HNE05_19490 [Aquipseudomonas campi]|uniref:Uncharacterized protein n=1 Tax=Aquipseudomonas campi TaxID=2731681 RepID=A0A6M8FGR6_9GAMM|nr:hypothetical protein [Pseudomonas campi]QKE65453.1 hypothetical protein HNE05_19490 [Pseudomonas campi]